MKPLQELTLKHLLENSAAGYKDKKLFGFVDGGILTYADFKAQVDLISTFLLDQGIVHGDRVALLSENCPHWGVAYFAVTCIGAIIVPILNDFHTSEIHHIIQHSEAKAIFVSEKLYPKIEEYKSDDDLKIILLDDFSIVQRNISKDILKKLIADGSKELQKIKNLVLKFTGLISEKVSEDDVASIIYTSGTTGHSKAVMLTHKNILSDAIATRKYVPEEIECRMISLLPLAHVYECTLGMIFPILIGGTVYYLRKPPTAAVLLPPLAELKPTVLLSVPLIIEKMYKGKILPEINKKKFVKLAYKVPSLRKAINKVAGKKLMKTFGGELKLFCIGGAALSSEVELFLREAEFPYSIGYGLTETSPLVAGTGAKDTKYLSTGPASIGAELKIDSPDPKTGEGEILVRGVMVMKGYYKDPEKTKEVISSDGWFRTGDLGCIDKDGYLFIKGRLKNMILGASGENIYPEAIESIVNRSEFVLESIVFKQNGQLAARVFLDYEKIDSHFETQKKSESEQRKVIAGVLDQLKEEVNNNVSSFAKISKMIEQVNPFEKTPTQKIKRYLYV
ncbi:MAG: AMP-binding protein [Ignavibacteria bacterium]|nr:AMP-binding protein [Ignavibacteria bacterium]